MEEKFKFKIQDSVQWYEGQLLYPHHYQQMRYEIQQLSLCYLSICSPWYWGVRLLEIDEALLPSGMIRINKILAVFPDGSVLEKTNENSLPLEMDISPLKEELKDKEITIYLAVVKRQPDNANTAGDFPRYTSIESLPIVDENTGESPINISKLSLRAFLIPEDKLSARLSAFPLLKVTLQDGSFLKTNFIPPTTIFNKDTLVGEYLKTLITKVRRHIAYLSVRLQSLKTRDLSSVLDYYSNVYNILTSRILALEAVYEIETTHPYDIYKELNICAGSYCALNQSKAPPVFPPYNHNDLKATFEPVMNFINEIIESVKSASISIIFDQEDRVFHQEIKEAYLTSDTLIIGIHLGTKMSPAAGASWIKGAVIACDFSIKDIKEKRILGAERELVEQIPEMGLMAVHNQIFVKVTLNPSFIKAGASLKIFNPSDREDTRPEDLFLYVVG
jgi:type VI secretion system protein ImpJ